MLYVLERLSLRIQESRLVVGAGVLLLLAGYLAATAAPFLPGRGHRTQLWRGFYVIVAPAEQVSAKAEQELARLGRLISARSSMVELNRFDSMETLPFAQLEDRLDPLDLRYDDYLRRIGGYFTAADAQQRYSVLYLRPTRSPIFLLLRLWRSEVAWRLIEPDPIATLAPALLFAMLVVLRLIPASKRRWTLATTALPWMVALPFGGLSLFIAAVAQWWSGNYTLQNLQRRPKWPQLLFALSIALLTLPLAGSAALIASGGFVCAALLRSALVGLRRPARHRRPSPCAGREGLNPASSLDRLYRDAYWPCDSDAASSVACCSGSGHSPAKPLRRSG